MGKVILFSTSTYPWCKRAERYLKEKRVLFKEINVEKDAKAVRDLVLRTGQTAVPVLKIGRRLIVGFDRARIERELGRAS